MLKSSLVFNIILNVYNPAINAGYYNGGFKKIMGIQLNSIQKKVSRAGKFSILTTKSQQNLFVRSLPLIYGRLKNLFLMQGQQEAFLTLAKNIKVITTNY
jgi:hypothetical protein